MVATAMKIIVLLLVTGAVACLISGSLILLLPVAGAAWMTWIVARVLEDL